jgi:hypothetical protein
MEDAESTCYSRCRIGRQILNSTLGRAGGHARPPAHQQAQPELVRFTTLYFNDDRAASSNDTRPEAGSMTHAASAVFSRRKKLNTPSARITSAMEIP